MAVVEKNRRTAPEREIRLEVIEPKLSLFDPAAPAYVDMLTADFDALPLVYEGESKTVRALTPTLVAIGMKPTVYSAQETALKAFHTLAAFLTSLELEIQDVCCFITQDGRAIYGEVSPDCMRVKYHGDDLDKDVFRKGKAETEAA